MSCRRQGLRRIILACHRRGPSSSSTLVHPRILRPLQGKLVSNNLLGRQPKQRLPYRKQKHDTELVHKLFPSPGLRSGVGNTSTVANFQRAMSISSHRSPRVHTLRTYPVVVNSRQVRSKLVLLKWSQAVSETGELRPYHELPFVLDGSSGEAYHRILFLMTPLQGHNVRKQPQTVFVTNLLAPAYATCDNRQDKGT